MCLCKSLSAMSDLLDQQMFERGSYSRCVPEPEIHASPASWQRGPRQCLGQDSTVTQSQGKRVALE